MIEVIGKDGRVFRFQNGTSEDIIQAALDKHYGGPEVAEDPVMPVPATPVAQATVVPPPVTQHYQAPPPPRPPYYDTQPDFEDDNRPPTNTAMQVTMLAGAAALGILVVVGGLWATGMIGKKPAPASNAAVTAPAVNSAFVPTPQPDMRQAQVATQIRKEAKSEAVVLKEVVAGATVDVLGEQTIAGTQWLRVRVDQTTGGEGYVIASHLGAIGSAPPPVVVQQGGVGGVVNGVQPPAVPGQIVVPNVPTPPPAQAAEVAIPQATYYAATNQLNTRAGPSPNSPIVERVDFGTAMTAFAQNGSSGNTWYKVRTQSGRVGWVKASLVSSNPGVAPEVAPPPPIQPTSKPPIAGGGTIARPPMGYYVQAGAARDETEVQELIARAADARSCTGSAPKVYASDGFVKTKTRGMALIAYGPFRDRDDAIAFRNDLRPCIGDTFINHQPY